MMKYDHVVSPIGYLQETLDRYAKEGYRLHTIQFRDEGYKVDMVFERTEVTVRAVPDERPEPFESDSR